MANFTKKDDLEGEKALLSFSQSIGSVEVYEDYLFTFRV